MDDLEDTVTNINKSHNILDVATIMAKKLNIDNGRLEDLIKRKIPDHENIVLDEFLIYKINLLLHADKNIDEFENKLSNGSVRNNFNILKEHLAELQISMLIKKIKKVNDVDDILGIFLTLLNNKLGVVNDILTESLQSGGKRINEDHADYFKQSGGGTDFSPHYVKYIKYKLKNHELMNTISTL